MQAGMQRVLAAPGSLDLEQRAAFRREAEALLERLEPGGTLVVDFSGTRSVDSAGLGTLLVIQRRATARRQTVRLRHVHAEIRSLLTLSRLADLFELEPAEQG